MRLKQVSTLMIELRRLASIIGPNNKRLSDWVDDYLNGCALNGQTVNILTQWCVSRDLLSRWQASGEKFVPTKRERQLFSKELPNLLALFVPAGLRANWWITFNRSYLDSGRIKRSIELAYEEMIRSLASPLEASGEIILLNWEEDVLSGQPKPSDKVLANQTEYVSVRAWAVELERHSNWSRVEAGLTQSDQELERDVLFQIACEAEEGRMLSGPDSPIGE